MDTDALKAFVAIARTGSFSLAAHALFLTQPAISKRISKLEEQLNHKLFDRLGRELHLTEAGRLLLSRAEILLREWSELERDVRELSGEIVGTLRVATSHHCGLHHLPPVLRQFVAEHAGVNLQFEFLDSELAHQRILSGDCELGIVTLAPAIPEPLAQRILWPDPLEFVVANNHELTQEAQLSMTTLAKYNAVLPGVNTYTGRLIKSAFETQNQTLKIGMATNYLETIKMMVSVGLGWSVLPRTLLDGSLAVIHPSNLHLSRDLGVIWHPRRSFSNAGRAFYEILLNYGKKTP